MAMARSSTCTLRLDAGCLSLRIDLTVALRGGREPAFQDMKQSSKLRCSRYYSSTPAATRLREEVGQIDAHAAAMQVSALEFGQTRTHPPAAVTET